MKNIRYLFILVVGLILYTFFLGGAYRNIYLAPDGGKGRFGKVADFLKSVGEVPSTVVKYFDKDEFVEVNDSTPDGFTYYTSKVANEYPKLLIGFKDAKFSHKIDLVDINTGDLIKQWRPDNEMLYDRAYNEDNPGKPMKGSDLYLMHPLMTRDSSLLFTSQLTSLIAKIDSESDLMWLKNDRVYHHTLEMDSTGYIWSCTRPFKSNKYSFLPDTYEQYSSTLLDDHITKMDPETGEILFNKSVIDILVENGYKDLILYKGQVTSDPIHLNDIQPALTTTEYWNEGDLLLSCRNLSVVFLYRPTNNKILWLKHGPWLTQHDADFHGEDQIVVFGNDVLRDESRIDPPLSGQPLVFSEERPNNEVYVYHMENDSVSTPYKNFMKSEKVRTITSGRCDILPNGDVFVEETNYGRLLIGDSTSKKIEYVKRLNEEHISRMFWSRIVL